MGGDEAMEDDNDVYEEMELDRQREGIVEDSEDDDGEDLMENMEQ